MSKIKLPNLFLLGIVIVLLNLHANAQDPNFHVYLCFGQSNMEGQGAILRVDKTVDERFMVMDAIGCSNLGRTQYQWSTAIPPLCRCDTKLSPADYFGRTMVANLPADIKVGVINVSVAGCKIELFDKDSYEAYAATAESWMKPIINEYGGNPYQRLVDMAKKAQETGVIKGILMHQGESNTGDNSWPAKVQIVYNNLLADLGLEPNSLPLLAGEVVHSSQGGSCASMNSIIAKLPQTIPNAYVISSRGCTDASDNLHFDTEGYRKIGRRYAVKMLSLMGYNAVYAEPECATPGTNWNIFEDKDASNTAYVTPKDGLTSTETAPTAETDVITIPVKLENDTTYYLFARLNCTTEGKNKLWVKVDDGNFVLATNSATQGWQWLSLGSHQLTAGDHTITLAYAESGVGIDKICVKNSDIAPVAIGEEPAKSCTPEYTVIGANIENKTKGFNLAQNYPNPFSTNTKILFELPTKQFVSVKIYNLQGVQVAQIAGKQYSAGQHTINFDNNNLAQGCYFYTLKAGLFTATRKMMVTAK